MQQKNLTAASPSSQVFLRSYPFANFEQVSIPFEGQGLLGAILQKELLAQGVLSSRLKPSEVIKNRFLGGTVKSGEIAMLMHVRGTQVTVFPRAMLVHPIVAGAKLNPQDCVVSLTCNPSSFFLGPNDGVKELNESDPIHKWFHSTFFPRYEVDASTKTIVEFRGELVPSSLRGRTVLERQEKTLGRFLRKLDSENEVEKSVLGNALVIATVKRQAGVWSLNFVTPLQHAGAFQYNSPLYSKVFEVKNPSEIGSWDQSFASFLGFELTDGDIVEVSNHGSITLFQVQAPVIPVEQ